jgi:hypothetical protein
VAESLLFDLRIRTEALPRSNRQIRKYAGADKIIYAGYFPMGLSLERIMTDMQVPSRTGLPKFLRDNAQGAEARRTMIDPRLPLAELHLHLYGTIRATTTSSGSAHATSTTLLRKDFERLRRVRRCATYLGTAPVILTRRMRFGVVRFRRRRCRQFRGSRRSSIC